MLYAPTRSIMRAGMDGSSPVTVVSGFYGAYGLTIDFKTSKLFWADVGGKVESSNFQGGDRRAVVQNQSGGPYGIAVANDRVYWGEYRGKKLKSSTTTGEDIIVLHSDTSNIRHITLVPNFYLPQNRTNHCAGHTCAKVCVLTAASFRCLD